MPKAGELALSWSVVTCRAATLREGRSTLCTSWSGVTPSSGRARGRESQLPGAVVCVREPALLVWSVFGEGDSTAGCEVEARVLLGARFYQ